MRTFGAIALRVLLVLIGLVVCLQIYYLACVISYRFVNPDSTSFMRARLETLRQTNANAQLHQQWVPYAAIAMPLKRAVITSEDARFTVHDGVDWQAIEKAYDNNRRRHRHIKGGSTITQQLAKNLFLSGERTYLRKAQELVIAYMLEGVLGKRRILEMYLNVVEWGNGVFGAEAAARHYFGVSAAQLSAEQSARLALMLPAPRYFDTHRQSLYLNHSMGTVLRYLPYATVP